jgi:hypothetical protein
MAWRWIMGSKGFTRLDARPSAPAVVPAAGHASHRRLPPADGHRSLSASALWPGYAADSIPATGIDLIAWTQHLLLHGELAVAEPKKLRYQPLHVAARITRTARRTRATDRRPLALGRRPGHRLRTTHHAATTDHLSHDPAALQTPWRTPATRAGPTAPARCGLGRRRGSRSALRRTGPRRALQPSGDQGSRLIDVCATALYSMRIHIEAISKF